MHSVLGGGLLLTRWKQLSLATFLLFLNGSFFSISVFSEAVEKASVIPGALDDVWSSAMALMSLIAIPFAIYAGYLISDGVVLSRTASLPLGKSKTDRVRILSFLGALCISTMFFAGTGINNSIPNWVTFAVAMQGVPFNIFFILALELLAAWTPRHPGLAIGLGQMVHMFGAMFFSVLYELLIELFGCLSALYLSTASLVLVTAAVSFFLKWPPASFSEGAEQHVGSEARSQQPISLRRLPSIPAFWLYVFVIVTADAGFVFIPYFFKVGGSFGRPMHVLVNLFGAAFLVSALTRPLVGFMADSFRHGEGRFSIASKNSVVMLLFLQTGLFLVLIPTSFFGNFIASILCITLLFVLFTSMGCVAPILARDLFGPTNSALVFGAGGVIGFGVGEYVAAKMMSVVVGIGLDEGSSPSLYIPFYVICVFWSVGGLMCSLMLTKCSEAFDSAEYSDPIESLSVVENGTIVLGNHQKLSDMKNFGTMEKPPHPTIALAH